jgi:glycosyltransferase involved in cell wall biosynthesis
MISTSPKLSIVMPVYNRESYIQSAIDSILNQTFTDFEFIIINDGSQDNTVKLIETYDDSRIKLFHNDRNRGIVYSRNHGLQKVTGHYVGMFDSDDIALPEKFEKQVSFLDQNPEYAMVGAWVKWIDAEGKLTGKKWKLPASSPTIPAIMVFRNYFVQSTVVIRRQAIPEGGYSEGYDIAEDSKMWFDVSLKHKVANMQEYLLHYRMHDDNISNMSDKYVDTSKMLITHILSKLGINATEEELELHLNLKNNNPIRSDSEIKKYEAWLTKIYLANKQLKLYDEKGTAISCFYNC